MPRRATANEAPRTENAHRRILFVAIGLVLWMLAIGGRLVQLEIHQHDDLASRARNQQLSSIDTAPTRAQARHAGTRWRVFAQGAEALLPERYAGGPRAGLCRYR